MNVLQTLHRTLVWLSRIGYCRGFGIQSPWAYNFVRYVINEHYPYYAYGDIATQRPSLDPLTRKLGELYLRIANRVRPTTVVSYGGADAAIDDYLHAGCRDMHLVKVAETMPMDDCKELIVSLPEIDMLRMTPSGNFRSVFNEACVKAREGSVFIIECIHRDKEARNLWNETVRLLDGVVTFDLYYCGLVCFKSKLFKRNYIVNF